jgi:hypothetical protein
VRYLATFVNCMSSVDRMTENGEWERIRKVMFEIYFKVPAQNSPRRIYKTPQTKLNFSVSESDSLSLLYEMLTTNDSTLMTELGGRKRVLNTVDIFNFM